MDVWSSKIVESLIFEKQIDKEGKEWDITIIEAGFSKNYDEVTGFPRYYPVESVKDMAGLFEGCPVFAYEFNFGKRSDYDHLPERIRKALPDGLAGNVVGWVDTIRFVTEGKLGKLQGRFHVVANWLKEKLLNAYREGKQDLLGFSVDIQAETTNAEAEGRMANKVVKASRVNELTVVTNPAAGGQIERLVASQNGKGEKVMFGLKDIYSLIELDGNDTVKDLKSLKEEEQTEDRLLNYFKKIQFSAPVEGDSNPEINKKVESLQTLVEEIVKQITAKNYEQAIQLLNKLKSSYGYPTAYGYGGQYGYPYPKPAKSAEATTLPPVAKADTSDVSKQVKELQNQLDLMTAKSALDKVLASCKLPEPMKDELRSMFSGKVFQESELMEAVKTKQTTMTRLEESGKIKGLGDQSRVDVGDSGEEKIQKALDLLVEPTILDNEKSKYQGFGRGFRNLREAYTQITGDYDVRGVVESKRLTESITTDFAYALGTSMNRKLLREYQKWPQEWRKLCTVSNLNDFKPQDLIRWGGFTTLETVAEDAEYPSMVTPYEERAQYSAGTKGGTFYVNRRMIINDDLRAIRKFPVKMAQAASKALNQFVFDLLLNYSTAINNGTIYDGLALYHANHFNTSQTAMSYDSIQDGITKLRRQFEYGAKDAINDSGGISDSDTTCGVDHGAYFKVGDLVLMEAEIVKVTAIATNDLTIVRAQEGTTAAAHADNVVIYSLVDKIGIKGKYLIYPPELRSTAEKIINSPDMYDTANRASNPLYKQLELLESDRLRSDANNWYISADPNIYDVMEVGFIGGREEPELLVQDQATVGQVFTHDRITYKVRHEYGGVMTDFRSVFGALVS